MLDADFRAGYARHTNGWPEKAGFGAIACCVDIASAACSEGSKEGLLCQKRRENKSRAVFFSAAGRS